MNYRPEIDGLRALAVVPVVLFHAGLAGFAGGYVGVDVFFVISGYLITSIILGDIRQQQFSYASFYERRARRILPALFLVMLACVPFAWLLLAPDPFEAFADSLTSTTLFYSNFLFWRESGYFDTAAELKPLLHTWSLSIEEQFYLLFPIALMAVWRRARAHTGKILLGGALGSLALAEIFNGPRPEATFFLLHTRAWELLLGAWLAYRAATQPITVGNSMGPLLTLAGLLLIAAAVVLFDQQTPHPGLLTLAPALGTALIIVYGGSPGLAHRLLTQRVVVGVGLISYSLYLWHQPVFAFARASSLHELPTAVMLLLIAVAVLLAVLTWRYVEAPFRNRKQVSARRLWQIAGITAALIIGIGVTGAVSHGLPQRFAGHEQALLAVKKQNANQSFRIDGKLCSNRALDESCVLGVAGTAPDWALVGDSHAGSLARALHEQLLQRQQAGVQMTRTGCLYLPGFQRMDNGNCGDWSRAVHDWLLASPATHVVIAGRYVMQLERSRFDNGEGGVEAGEPGGYTPENAADLADAERRRLVLAGYQQSIRDLLAAGKTVYLVYPVPEVGWNVPDQLFKLRVLHRTQEPVTTSHAVYQTRSATVVTAFDALGNPPGLIRVYPDRVLCNVAIAGRCSTELGGKILYADDDHPSFDGSALIIAALFASGPTDPAPPLLAPAE